jgi:protein SCO1/2
VQNAYLMDESILLLSHTVHPEYDSIPILKKYSKDYNILSTKWNLVRGEKIDINNIAKRGYFAVNQDITGDFIHTENVVLVDWEYRIRGIYNGTSSISIEQLIGDIKILKNEMNRLL